MTEKAGAHVCCGLATRRRRSPNATAVEGRVNKECGMGYAGSWLVFKCSVFLVIVPSRAVCLPDELGPQVLGTSDSVGGPARLTPLTMQLSWAGTAEHAEAMG